MKRYLLFSGDFYYTSGGWNDFVDSFDSVEEAFNSPKAKNTNTSWFQIVDSTTGIEILS
jgi:hypothetical protein